MTNTTDTYWDVDGVSLHTFAQNIVTLEGQTPPPLRGDDITVPYRLGQLWVPKTADARTLSMGMWVRGCNPDGSMPTSQSARYQFFDNWRALRNLLWRPGEQFLLTKRFPYNGQIRSAVARGQFAAGLEPAMSGRTAAQFTVDIKLTDPYFYDHDYTTFNIGNGNTDVNLPGDVPTDAIVLKINGPRNNITVQNNNKGIWVNYVDNLNTSDLAIIDCKNFSAITIPNGQSGYDSTASIKHGGAPAWLTLQPGITQIGMGSASGNYAGQLQAKGAWI